MSTEKHINPLPPPYLPSSCKILLVLYLILLLLPEYLIQQPPEIQVVPEIVYKTVQNEQGILQNPTGWFVFLNQGLRNSL